MTHKNNIIFAFILTLCIYLGFNPSICNAQNYDALKSQLQANFPTRFEGKEIHPKTYRLGQAIINQITEDMRKIKFDEQKAQWQHVNDYVLFDATSRKQIGTSCYLVYKTADNKVIGTYVMNTENPVNNRVMHTSYRISGGSYSIKKKIYRDDFSHVICKAPIPKSPSRFF